MTTGQLLSIQVLRGLAALAVLIGHLWQIEVRFIGEEVTSSILLVGFAGVDLFFVLSGFVMVYVTRNMDTGPRSNAHFLYKRVTRIYPPYWVFTGLMILALLIGPSTSGEPFDTDPVLPSLLLLPQRDLPILPVGWTLVHEMYFYIVFTALLFLPRKWLVHGLLAWLGLILLGSYLDWHRLNPALNIVFNPLTVEFLLGAGLAFWQPKLPRLLAIAAIGLGIAGLAAAGFWLNPITIENFPAFWERVGMFGVPVFLIVLGMLQFEPKRPSGLYAGLVKLGDWSYSLYLGHLIFLAAGAWVWSQIIPDLGWYDNLAMVLLGTIGCIIAAGLSYHWIERPMLIATRRFGHKVFKS